MDFFEQGVTAALGLVCPIGSTVFMPQFPSFGERWPYWEGGYESWVKDRSPLANSYMFISDCEELRLATMLEF